MLSKERNRLVIGNLELSQIDANFDQEILESFDCGDADLNEYFQLESLLNKAELISQPYFLHVAAMEREFPVAIIDLCNDSIRKHSSKQSPGYFDNIELHPDKQFAFLPAVKITRFGVSVPFQRLNIGTNVLNMVKTLFVTENRTGCRFLTVDAYNNEKTLNFYYKNEFKPFYDQDKNKQTRSLFYDLKRLSLPQLSQPSPTPPTLLGRFLRFLPPAFSRFSNAKKDRLTLSLER